MPIGKDLSATFKIKTPDGEFEIRDPVSIDDVARFEDFLENNQVEYNVENPTIRTVGKNKFIPYEPYKHSMAQILDNGGFNIPSDDWGLHSQLESEHRFEVDIQSVFNLHKGSFEGLDYRVTVPENKEITIEKIYGIKYKGENEMIGRVKVVESFYGQKQDERKVKFEKERKGLIEGSATTSTLKGIREFIVASLNKLFEKDIKEEVCQEYTVENMISAFRPADFYTAELTKQLNDLQEIYQNDIQEINEKKSALYERLELCGDTPTGNTQVDILKALDIIKV